MIENYKIKRGLFQLGRATVKELAAFADAKESTVRNYLNSRSDLCVQESAIGGRGRGRPTNIWTVTPSGQKILRRELNQLWQLKDPELDDERAAALGRIRRSISQIAEQIGELESHAGSSELVEVLDFLEARTRAMTLAVEKLKQSGQDAAMEALVLEGLGVRLGRLQTNTRTIEVAAEAIQTSVSATVSAWTENLAKDLNTQSPGAIGEDDVFVPAHAEYGPLLVLDATEGGMAWLGFLETARTFKAPTMRLPVLQLDPAERLSVLRNVASHCAEVVGAMAQVIFAFDSRQADTTKLLASFEKFDKARKRAPTMAKTSAPGSGGPVANTLLASQVLNVATTAAAAESAALLMSHLSPAARLIADEMRGLSASGTTRRYLASYWMDAAEPNFVMHEGGSGGPRHLFETHSILTVPIRSQAEGMGSTAPSAFAWPRVWPRTSQQGTQVSLRVHGIEKR